MLVAVRKVLCAFTMFDEPLELQKLIDSINVETETGFDLDYAQLTEQQHFRAIYALSTNETDRPFADLLDLTKLCANAWHLLSNYTNLLLMLKTKEMEEFFLNTLFRLVQISSVNSHVLGSPSVRPINFGAGSFALCSLLNHSCAPNVVRVVNEITMIVIVKRAIKAGEQIFDNYGPIYEENDISSRQSQLKVHYNFDCQCEACVNKYPLLEGMVELQPARAACLKLFQQVDEDIEGIKTWNQATLKQKFEEYGKYLKDNCKKFPSFEFHLAERLFLRLTTFMMNVVPLEKQLKPLNG